VTRHQRERKHARRVAHQRQVGLGTTRSGSGRSADELRNQRRDERRAARATPPVLVRERPDPVVYPKIPAQSREVTLAKRAARKAAA
jgi:hypothetical protein